MESGNRNHSLFQCSELELNWDILRIFGGWLSRRHFEKMFVLDKRS